MKQSSPKLIIMNWILKLRSVIQKNGGRICTPFFCISSFQTCDKWHILTLDRAVNQKMHLCKKAEEQRNRSIRSKISEYHLDLWTWLNSVRWQMRTPTESRWTCENYITRCHRRLELVAVPVGERTLAEWEPAPDRGLGSSVTHGWAGQPGRKRSAFMFERTPLTHNQHQPFRE